MNKKNCADFFYLFQSMKNNLDMSQRWELLAFYTKN